MHKFRNFRMQAIPNSIPQIYKHQICQCGGKYYQQKITQLIQTIIRNIIHVIKPEQRIYQTCYMQDISNIVQLTNNSQMIQEVEIPLQHDFCNLPILQLPEVDQKQLFELEVQLKFTEKKNLFLIIYQIEELIRQIPVESLRGKFDLIKQIITMTKQHPHVRISVIKLLQNIFKKISNALNYYRNNYKFIQIYGKAISNKQLQSYPSQKPNYKPHSSNYPSFSYFFYQSISLLVYPGSQCLLRIIDKLFDKNWLHWFCHISTLNYLPLNLRKLLVKFITKLQLEDFQSFKFFSQMRSIFRLIIQRQTIEELDCQSQCKILNIYSIFEKDLANRIRKSFQIDQSMKIANKLAEKIQAGEDWEINIKEMMQMFQKGMLCLHLNRHHLLKDYIDFNLYSFILQSLNPQYEQIYNKSKQLMDSISNHQSILYQQYYQLTYIYEEQNVIIKKSTKYYKHKILLSTLLNTNYFCILIENGMQSLKTIPYILQIIDCYFKFFKNKQQKLYQINNILLPFLTTLEINDDVLKIKINNLLQKLKFFPQLPLVQYAHGIFSKNPEKAQEHFKLLTKCQNLASYFRESTEFKIKPRKLRSEQNLQELIRIVKNPGLNYQDRVQACQIIVNYEAYLKSKSCIIEEFDNLKQFMLYQLNRMKDRFTKSQKMEQELISWYLVMVRDFKINLNILVEFLKIKSPAFYPAFKSIFLYLYDYPFIINKQKFIYKRHKLIHPNQQIFKLDFYNKPFNLYQIQNLSSQPELIVVKDSSTYQQIVKHIEGCIEYSLSYACKELSNNLIKALSNYFANVDKSKNLKFLFLCKYILSLKKQPLLVNLLFDYFSHNLISILYEISYQTKQKQLLMILLLFESFIKYGYNQIDNNMKNKLIKKIATTKFIECLEVIARKRDYCKNVLIVQILISLLNKTIINKINIIGLILILIEGDCQYSPYSFTGNKLTILLLKICIIYIGRWQKKQLSNQKNGFVNSIFTWASKFIETRNYKIRILSWHILNKIINFSLLKNNSWIVQLSMTKLNQQHEQVWEQCCSFCSTCVQILRNQQIPLNNQTFCDEFQYSKTKILNQLAQRISVNHLLIIYSYVDIDPICWVVILNLYSNLIQEKKGLLQAIMQADIISIVIQKCALIKKNPIKYCLYIQSVIQFIFPVLNIQLIQSIFLNTLLVNYILKCLKKIGDQIKRSQLSKKMIIITNQCIQNCLRLFQQFLKLCPNLFIFTLKKLMASKTSKTKKYKGYCNIFQVMGNLLLLFKKHSLNYRIMNIFAQLLLEWQQPQESIQQKGKQIINVVLGEYSKLQGIKYNDQFENEQEYNLNRMNIIRIVAAIVSVSHPSKQGLLQSQVFITILKQMILQLEDNDKKHSRIKTDIKDSRTTENKGKKNMIHVYLLLLKSLFRNSNKNNGRFEKRLLQINKLWQVMNRLLNFSLRNKLCFPEFCNVIRNLVLNQSFSYIIYSKNIEQKFPLVQNTINIVLKFQSTNKQIFEQTMKVIQYMSQRAQYVSVIFRYKLIEECSKKVIKEKSKECNMVYILPILHFLASISKYKQCQKKIIQDKNMIQGLLDIHDSWFKQKYTLPILQILCNCALNKQTKHIFLSVIRIFPIILMYITGQNYSDEQRELCCCFLLNLSYKSVNSIKAFNKSEVIEQIRWVCRRYQRQIESIKESENQSDFSNKSLLLQYLLQILGMLND